MTKRRPSLAILPYFRRPAAGWLLLLTSASCVPAGMADRTATASDPILASASNAAPPAPPLPLALQPLAPETAEAMNAAIPVANLDNPAARPFSLVTRSMIDRMRSVDCLTQAVYYEAASEPDDGQRAVAQVVLNRMRHPSYPNSVCGVVYQGSERTSGCQFTFTCDGSLLRTPSASGWARARRVAGEALAGRVFEPVGYSTHYHADYVLPYWASSLVKSAVIGAHIFYRWNGGWGQPAAFRQRYAGFEPLPAPKARPLLLPTPSNVLLEAELAAIRSAGSMTAQPMAASSAPLQPQGDEKLPKVVYQGPGLPESQVLDAYRYSGVPRDELPAAVAASGK